MPMDCVAIPTFIEVAVAEEMVARGYHICRLGYQGQ